MPKFTIDTKSEQNPTQTFEKIKKFLETDQDLKKFDPKLQCTFNASQLKGEAKGSQFKANISVNPNADNSKCVVSIEVDLPLMLTPFKGKVQETLQKKLAKALA